MALRSIIRKLKLLPMLSSATFLHLHAHITIFCICSALHLPAHGTNTGFKQVQEDEKCQMVDHVFTSNVASNYDLMKGFMSGGLHLSSKNRLVFRLNTFPRINLLGVAGGTDNLFLPTENIVYTLYTSYV